MLGSVLAVLVPILLVLLVLRQLSKGAGYLILLPILYAMGRSVYIDTYAVSVLGLSSDQIGLLVLVVSSLALVVLRPGGGGMHWVSFGSVLVGVFALWLGTTAILSIVEGQDFGKAVSAAIFSASIPIATFAWMAAFSRINRDELLGVIRMTAVVTVGACVLYVLQAVGIHVYPYDPYMAVSVGGRTMVRDFLTFPYLSVPLVLAWTVVSAESGWWRLVAAVICLAASAATITRSILLAALLSLVVAVVLGGSGAERDRRRRLLVTTASVGLAIMLVLALAVDEFWAMRLVPGFSDVSITGRMAAIVGNVRSGSFVDSLVGYGYLGSIPVRPGVVLGDSLWIGVVYRFGLIGAFLLAVALLGAAYDARRCAHGSFDVERPLRAVAAAMPVATLLLSFAGVPGAVHLGFALAMGPSVSGGLIRPVVSTTDVRTVLLASAPDVLRDRRARRAFAALCILVMIAVEVWLGMRIAS